MIDALAFALTFGCLVAAGVLVVRLVRARFSWATSWPLLALVQVGLVVQLFADVAGLAAGHRPSEPGTHVAYLVTSVLMLPPAAVQVRGDDGRWAALLLVVAFVVTAVLVVRLQTTWRSAH